jgi:hypothetical protein
MVAFVISFAGAAVRPFFTHAAVTVQGPASTASLSMKTAIPFLPTPPNLDSSAIGYAGFDPVNLSSYVLVP